MKVMVGEFSLKQVDVRLTENHSKSSDYRYGAENSA
jgi:hypothetical protein